MPAFVPSIVISLGGWTWSKYFSDAALTAASRQAFVSSCVDLFIKGNLPDPGWGGMGGTGAAAAVFDGIDVDWEIPASADNTGNIYRPEDTQNFTLLLREFRRQLDVERPGLLLTIAAPAGVDKYEKIELDKIVRYLNYVNLMTYDFHGTWDTSTNFQSNLYATANDPASPRLSVDATVQAYLESSVPTALPVQSLSKAKPRLPSVRCATGSARRNHAAVETAVCYKKYDKSHSERCGTAVPVHFECTSHISLWFQPQASLPRAEPVAQRTLGGCHLACESLVTGSDAATYEPQQIVPDGR